jgi:hypothetical protein
MLELDPVDKSIGGIIGLFIGLFIGAIAMFRKLSTNDSAIEDHADRLTIIEKSFMPRLEIIEMYKEHQKEMKDLHHSMAGKLDTMNDTLTKIQIGLANKLDR